MGKTIFSDYPKNLPLAVGKKVNLPYTSANYTCEMNEYWDFTVKIERRFSKMEDINIKLTAHEVADLIDVLTKMIAID